MKGNASGLAFPAKEETSRHVFDRQDRMRMRDPDTLIIAPHRFEESLMRFCVPVSPLRAVVVSLGLFTASAAIAGPPPPLDHVIVIVMENKSYDQVRTQPYTA